jgi:hypothetical protein
MIAVSPLVVVRCEPRVADRLSSDIDRDPILIHDHAHCAHLPCLGVLLSGDATQHGHCDDRGRGPDTRDLDQNYHGSPSSQGAVPRFGFQSGLELHRAATTKTSPILVLIASQAQRHEAVKLGVVHLKLATAQELPAARTIASSPDFIVSGRSFHAFTVGKRLGSEPKTVSSFAVPSRERLLDDRQDLRSDVLGESVPSGVDSRRVEVTTFRSAGGSRSCRSSRV